MRDAQDLVDPCVGQVLRLARGSSHQLTQQDDLLGERPVLDLVRPRPHISP